MLTYNTKKYISKIGDLSIEFSEWTSKDQTNYLKLIESSEKLNKEITEKDIINTLLVPSVPELKSTKLKLSSAQKKKLLIDIRKISISEFIEDNVSCPSCGNKDDIKLKIDDIISYKQASYEPISVDDITITLKEKYIPNELTSNKSVISFIYEDFINKIEYVTQTIDGEETEIITPKNKTKDIKEFIDSIPSKMFNDIFEKYQSMVDEVVGDYIYQCPKCGHKETLDYSVIPDFLWV